MIGDIVPPSRCVPVGQAAFNISVPSNESLVSIVISEVKWVLPNTPCLSVGFIKILAPVIRV